MAIFYNHFKSFKIFSFEDTCNIKGLQHFYANLIGLDSSDI